MKGRVGAVCNRRAWPPPPPRSSTAAGGAAARAICSADWAARFDHASRLKVAGRRGVGSGDMAVFPRSVPWKIRSDLNVWSEDDQTHPFPDKAGRRLNFREKAGSGDDSWSV